MKSRKGYVAAIDDAVRRGIVERVLDWYDANGRDLPWRRTRDPYAVLVSEILLHQTQVRTVLPVYETFLRRFPDVFSLAAAELAEVKAITDPLGYKVRGQWLHQIARVVVDQFDGRFPDTVESLMALPGVGRYTAGAVVSFAYERPAPILDTNVNRLLGRYFGIDFRDARADTRHRLWALAEALVPEDRVHAFNQALMDLGATVCTARRPECLLCPLHADCQTGGWQLPGSGTMAAESRVRYRRRGDTADGDTDRAGSAEA